MKYAVFFRNVNLGHPGSPTKAQLEAAFLAVGALSASSFLTNGTLIFTASAKSSPPRILSKASALLQRECELVEPGFVRSVTYLGGLVKSNPFEAIDASSVYEFCITFLSASASASGELPLASKKKDVEVLRITEGEVFSLSRKIGKSPGSPNAFLEKHLGFPTSTRKWNTIVRLVQKYG
jgi:uncharacterized protein (DUF1697 family)